MISRQELLDLATDFGLAALVIVGRWDEYKVKKQTPEFFQRKGARTRRRKGSGAGSAACALDDRLGRGRQRNYQPRMNANGRESGGREGCVEGGCTRLLVWP